MTSIATLTILRPMRTVLRLPVIFALSGLLAVACTQASPTHTPAPTLTPTPTFTPTPTPAPTPLTPTPETTLITGPSPAGPLYTTDFADGWSLDPGWQVSQQDGDFVLHGQGNGQAIFTAGTNWTNYEFKFRLKVLTGEVNVNYRLVNDTRFTRYYFAFNQEGLTGVTKEDGGVFTGMAASARNFTDSETWHTVEIRGFEGHLRVLVDGLSVLDATDEAPLFQGTIGFLTTDDSELFVDDIEVLTLIEHISYLVRSRPSVLDYVDRPPPIASLITIGSPGPDGVTLVTGHPGSVPPLVLVSVATTEYADEVTVTSAGDGGFSASVLSAPGATIHVRYDPDTDVHVRSSDPHAVKPNNHWPGTLIRVVDPLAVGDDTRFSGAGLVAHLTDDVEGGVYWAVAGQASLDGAEAINISGTLRIFNPAGVNVPPPVAARSTWASTRCSMAVAGKWRPASTSCPAF